MGPKDARQMAVNGRRPNTLKKISGKEKEFARLLAADEGPIRAARIVFNWKCEPNTKESQKARDLARSKRVKEEVAKLKKEQADKDQVKSIITTTSRIDWDNLRQFAFDRLTVIRDDPTVNSRARVQAINALEKLHDPAKDINLILRWLNVVWNGYVAHCPCCHTDFPLSRIKNEKLEEFREKFDLYVPELQDNHKDRVLYILSQGEKRKIPHPAQMRALNAPERHLAGTGAARAGKSALLAMFGEMYFMLPGVEIWILARVYDDARSEMEYIEQWLGTLFFPFYEHMVKREVDQKSGEVILKSRWGSELRIKSGRSKGSITARELEACLVAEPAWVEAELFEEVRARMSSRLGRIIAVGTPKGYGGFIHRMYKMAGLRGGKRVREEDRLIENGSPWIKSVRKFSMDPTDNPEYVKGELEAAKEELTEAEYRSEFMGEMYSDSDALFPHIKEEHLRNISRDEFANCVFVTGIDQGEKNFAAVIVGYDGHNIYATNEYFDDSNKTIRGNLVVLNKQIPSLIGIRGGMDDAWKLTIFDADPVVSGLLDEMEDESRPWKTEITYRPKNVKEFLNWRQETYMWINQMAMRGRLWFHPETDLLHDQLREALIKPVQEGKESGRNLSDKGWVIKNVWRGDHVVDAFVLACWSIYQGQIEIPETYHIDKDPWAESRKAFEYNRMLSEKKDLQGWGRPADPNVTFKEVFGRPRRGGSFSSLYRGGYYGDES